MNQTLLFSGTGVLLFAMGLVALLGPGHLLRKILAANIMGSGVFLLLVALAGRIPGPDPDPVPLAMVLTGIVVTVSATALALTLLGLLDRKEGDADD